MAHARAHGYPVPRVYQWTSTDMVMDRLDGPSMLADLVRRPWRLVRHARTLAELHRRLHAIPARPTCPLPWARVNAWCTSTCTRARSC